MKFRNLMLAAASLATVTAVALAVQNQFAVRADPLNLVTARLAGSWKLDATMTGRLDPQHAQKVHQSFVFVDDPNIIAYMQSGSDRFKDLRIYSAGQVQVDGENSTHPYLTYGENGNMKLFWCTPANNDPIGAFEIKTLQIAIARDKTADFLILGGDVRGESSAVYARA